MQLVRLHKDEGDEYNPVDESPDQILCSYIGASVLLSAESVDKESSTYPAGRVLGIL